MEARVNNKSDLNEGRKLERKGVRLLHAEALMRGLVLKIFVANMIVTFIDGRWQRWLRAVIFKQGRHAAGQPSLLCSLAHKNIHCIGHRHKSSTIFWDLY